MEISDRSLRLAILSGFEAGLRVKDEPIAASLLGSIKGKVGRGQGYVRRNGCAREIARRGNDRAHAASDANLPSRIVDGDARNGLMKPLETFLYLRRDGSRKDEEKLFTAVSSGRVVASDALAQACGKSAKHRVSGKVTPRVVDALEEIDIHEHDGDGSPLSQRSFNFCVEDSQNCAAIQQAGETVVSSLQSHLFAAGFQFQGAFPHLGLQLALPVPQMASAEEIHEPKGAEQSEHCENVEPPEIGRAHV